MTPRQTSLNPRRLLKLFTVVSAASVVVIIVYVSFGISAIITKKNIETAELDAVAITKALYELERDVLYGTDASGRGSVQVSKEHFAVLDERMRFFLAPMNIIKIKVFSRDKVIVYSTDQSIIGQANPDNAKLSEAMNGTVVSNLGRKDEIRDLAGEQRMDVDIVEAYLPLRDGDEIIGSFEVYLDITRRQDQVRDTVFASVVVISSVLILVFGLLYLFMRRGTTELTRVQDDLETISITDALTGAYNRRHLFVRASEELSRLKRQNECRKENPGVGVILIDIDHFKRINDEHGHIAGDAVIKEVAARVKGMIRQCDTFGRYGGEEFLLILPDTEVSGLRSVAERIWRAIRSEPFAIDDAVHIPVTCSLGASLMLESDDTIQAAIHRSDLALYRSKQTGRDKISYDNTKNDADQPA